MKLVEILKEADRRREYDDKFECVQHLLQMLGIHTSSDRWSH